MQKITPFLWYSKEAEEAAAFYASIFPDSRVGRVTALQSESPSGPPGSVKVVEFVLFGQPFRMLAAMIPRELHRRLRTSRRILIADNQPGRGRFGMDGRTIDHFDGQRRAQIQRPMWQIHEMTAEIRQRSAAEGPPIAPLEGQVGGVVRAILDGSQPQVVM